MSRKKGIFLEKEKETLKAITHDCIFKYLIRLKRRYLTHLISQRLRRLSFIFNADTLFSNYKSIIENTCTQIFTDREGFVYVHPMRSDSQYGEALNALAGDIGVPNTLISDHAG